MLKIADTISDDRLDGVRKDVVKLPLVQLRPIIETTQQQSCPAIAAAFKISFFSGFTQSVSTHRDLKQIHKFNSLFGSKQFGRVIEPYLAVDQITCV